MAFVSQSPRTLDIHKVNTSTATNIGPGAYKTENILNKSGSLNRKLPAFGFGEERKLNKPNDTASNTPGTLFPFSFLI